MRLCTVFAAAALAFMGTASAQGWGEYVDRERYWREPGDDVLHVEVEIDDPVYYTETFTMAREWVWSPDEQLQDWGCVDFGDKDAPPDIDELVRMLEEL